MIIALEHILFRVVSEVGFQFTARGGQSSVGDAVSGAPRHQEPNSHGVGAPEGGAGAEAARSKLPGTEAVRAGQNQAAPGADVNSIQNNLALCVFEGLCHSSCMCTNSMHGSAG